MAMISTELPPAWVDQFNGLDLDAKFHVAAVLLTVDDTGWPHLAYLSAGEVLAFDTHRISLALWATSGSTANLRRAGQGVLHAVAAGAIWETRLLAQCRPTADELVVFDATVIGVRRHVAPYAEVTGLIGFRLNDPVSTLDRWRRQIERIRAST
jgi:hypothetical protein